MTSKNVAPALASKTSLRKERAHHPLGDDGKIQPNGVEIKRWRKLHGLSQERLSGKTGLALKTIRNLENSQGYRCRPLTISTLAAFFSLEPRVLIKQEDEIQDIQLLTTKEDIDSAKIRIAEEACLILACTAADDRDIAYLRQIEETIQSYPLLMHYRILPAHDTGLLIAQHLKRLLEIHPSRKEDGICKTLHIGHLQSAQQHIPGICANEREALVMLPPLSGIIDDKTTALLFRNIRAVSGLIAFAKNLYMSGTPVATKAALSGSIARSARSSQKGG